MNATLKLMTFNLRYDRPDPGDRNWAVRKDSISELINHYQPDLIGTQELKANQLSELKKLLPNYESVGRDRQGDSTDEYCRIFYKKSIITCLETGDFCLSETPNILGSVTSDWENNLPRMVTWGIFQISDRSPSITLLNTHFPHLSVKAQEFSAKLIIEYCAQLDLTESYLFLTGDFNAPPQSRARKTLKQPLSDLTQLNDALENFSLGKQMTFHDFTGKAFKAIDTIYCDRRVKLKQVAIDNQRWKGIFPSDHFPVIGEWGIGNGE